MVVLSNDQETDTVTKELIGLLQSDEDARRLANVIKCEKEVDGLIGIRESQMKDLLKDLMYRVQRSEEEATRKEPEGSHKQRISQMENQAFQVIDNIKQMEMQSKDLENEIKKQNEDKEKVAQQLEVVNTSKAVEVPRIKDQLSLYANITSIKWDYESQNVKGYIASANHQNIKSFDIDPSKASNFEMVNQLWDLLDA